MKQEDKEILLKDLCSRLPYGVKFLRESWNYEWDQEMSVIEVLEDIDKDGYINNTKVYKVKDIKPYLRSISSMTEEEKEKYINLRHRIELGVNIDLMIYNYLNFLYSHHIDVSDRLLRKEIALEAPEGMYNLNK